MVKIIRCSPKINGKSTHLWPYLKPRAVISIAFDLPLFYSSKTELILNPTSMTNSHCEASLFTNYEQDYLQIVLESSNQLLLSSKWNGYKEYNFLCDIFINSVLNCNQNQRKKTENNHLLFCIFLGNSVLLLLNLRSSSSFFFYRDLSSHTLFMSPDKERLFFFFLYK